MRASAWRIKKRGPSDWGIFEPGFALIAIAAYPKFEECIRMLPMLQKANVTTRRLPRHTHHLMEY